MAERGRFAGYDVLAKRDTPSWDEITRTVFDQRLALTVPDGVLNETQLATLEALVTRMCPDPPDRPPTTTLAMIVLRIAEDRGDGYRHHQLPTFAECWRRGLDAVEAEAQARFDTAFALLEGGQIDAVLRAMEQGATRAGAWDDLPPRLFWSRRLLPDLVSAHWSQPSVLSAMGAGGPASPRGYVRLGPNRRDPWEAVEEGQPRRGLPRHHAG